MRGKIWAEMCFKHHSAFCFSALLELPAVVPECTGLLEAGGGGAALPRSLSCLFGLAFGRGGMVPQHRQAWMDFWLNRTRSTSQRWAAPLTWNAPHVLQPGRRARSHKCAIIPWIIWFRLSASGKLQALCCHFCLKRRVRKIQEKYAGDYLERDV